MNIWNSPLPFSLDIPLPPHPGAFGVQRKHHVHEGVDLYAPDGTLVTAVEDGMIVNVIDFTGPEAGSPWWLPTQAVLVEGASGVVVYGEINAVFDKASINHNVKAGGRVGYVKPVLKEDKGYGTSMLHLELHEPGTRDVFEWTTEKPESLLDPTPYLWFTQFLYIGDEAFGKEMSDMTHRLWAQLK